MPPSEVFVVVPAFNEGAALAETLTPLVREGFAVVVVDDCSRDDTWERLAALPVYALRHPINLGQGASLQSGMDFALARGALYIVHFDADGQHPQEQISRLLEPLRAGKADVVLGSRFLQASDAQKVPFPKRVLLRSAVWANYLMTGLLLSDAHNGFRALTREAASRIRLLENRFAHASEILEQFRRLGLRVVEVPSTIRYTEYSMRKGQPISNSLNILLDLVARRFLS